MRIRPISLRDFGLPRHLRLAKRQGALAAGQGSPLFISDEHPRWSEYQLNLPEFQQFPPRPRPGRFQQCLSACGGYRAFKTTARVRSFAPTSCHSGGAGATAASVLDRVMTEPRPPFRYPQTAIRASCAEPALLQQQAWQPWPQQRASVKQRT